MTPRPQPESSRVVLSRQERHTIMFALMVAIERIQETRLDLDELPKMRALLDRFSD